MYAASACRSAILWSKKKLWEFFSPFFAAKYRFGNLAWSDNPQCDATLLTFHSFFFFLPINDIYNNPLEWKLFLSSRRSVADKELDRNTTYTQKRKHIFP
jgi:hypothetical protein